jgi:hypothetical protein
LNVRKELVKFHIGIRALYGAETSVLWKAEKYREISKWSTTHLLPKNLKIKIHRTIILPVVLYGCETWSLTLREESRLRVFENRVLRRVFVPKRDEVTRECRKLHNEVLNDLYSLPNIVRVVKSRRIRWAGACGAYGVG